MSDGTKSPRRRVAQCCRGSLRAETIGEPLLVVACSCEHCQRRTGSPIGVSTYWPREDVVLSGPATRHVREGHTGAKYAVYFCPTCGSSVYWDPRSAERIGIAAGAFFDPDLPAPTVSVWEQSKHRWWSIPAETCFAQNPPLQPASR